MAETPAVCEQLHLPLQSGSDRILAAMHRGYNAERFLKKLDLARATIPDLTVSTDIIVGFPGETEADFQATLDVVERAQFDSAFTFQFSPRSDTPAASYPDQIGPDEVKERFGRLVELQNEITFERNRACVGGRFEVLVEGRSKRDESMASARTRGNRLVHLPAGNAPGDFLDVDIIRAGKHHLIGSPV